ncbi:MAG: rod shape-determining protein RodA [Calditrichota bacterium]
MFTMNDEKEAGRKLRQIDAPLVIILVLLVGSGLALIYSADHAQETFSHFERQLMVAIVGLVGMGILTFIPPRFYYALAYVFYGLGLFMLLLVDAMGIIGLGARRWLSIAGFHFQPSEPAKIAYILAAARLLSDQRDIQPQWRILLKIAMLALPPFILIVLQPDLGTSTVFPVVTVAVLAWWGLRLDIFIVLFLPLISLFLTVSPLIVSIPVVAGLVWLKRYGYRFISLALVVLACSAATITAPLAWNHLEDYQKDRLLTFLNPQADPLGAGYQVIQSQVAIGSGGVAGTGYLKGTQTQLRFLPEQHTDFIFSLSGEEFGFLGASFIILLFCMLGIRGYMTAEHAKNKFISIAAAGLTSMIIYHAMINIGMSLGTLPVTGLPLPYLSYGGTFLLVCMMGWGIVLSANVHRREP